MVLYEVSVHVRADMSVAFEEYMQNKHIPEIWATTCFRQIHFDKDEATHYRTSYQAASLADYERYIDQHAASMRADFMQHFPEGCTVTRQLWHTQKIWK
ncbi:DUF4286 family protein [Undibacterium sp. Ji22W]|uniref:DUF4286 family protein n=1 Tax=Undibacterium sp. Ji22W TaxID=3413038 RepID=UPI003BF144D6